MPIKLNGTNIAGNKLNTNNVVTEKLNNNAVYQIGPQLSSLDISLLDKFNWDDPQGQHGGVLLIQLYNYNSTSVTLAGKVYFNNSDYTFAFYYFEEYGPDGVFFGDDIGPSGPSGSAVLAICSNAFLTSDWVYPVKVEVWATRSGHPDSTKTSIIIPTDV